MPLAWDISFPSSLSPALANSAHPTQAAPAPEAFPSAFRGVTFVRLTQSNVPPSIRAAAVFSPQTVSYLRAGATPDPLLWSPCQIRAWYMANAQ